MDICNQDIISGLEKNEFVAFYQPQYDSITGKLKSAEALARWIKPDGKMIMPGIFIPIAEESDLVCRIDWYILECACKFQKSQIENGKELIPIAVNFSRKHLCNNTFAQKLASVVDGYGVPRNIIDVEITESSIAEFDSSIIDWVSSIRSEGFFVAIDDFGSGLSSLSLVKDIDASILKIDRSLLKGNLENDKERIVLESIINFANRLNLKTVAEGVETEEQLGFLRTAGCNRIQGFYFAKPMKEEEFRKVCEQNVNMEQVVDILQAQAPASAMSMLLEVITTRFPLIIMANITRNSFYMMTYDNFTSTSCPVSGIFSDLIQHGASTMHPDDQELFKNTFSIDNIMNEYNQGHKSIKVVTRQLGDDGVYRKVETIDYFVSSPSSEDVLVVTLCQNLD